MSLSATAKSKRRTTLHIGVQELKCKNGCGFYGNPEWQGYCSKCHRDLYQKPKHDAKHASKKLSRSVSDAQDSSLSLTFSKFEEKKKQQSEKRSKTIKSIIKRGNTFKESSAQSSWKDHRQRSIETHCIGKDFADFLKILPENANSDVRKQIQAQIERVQKSNDKTIDDRSELMQDFYQFMFNRCETYPYYQELNPEQVEKLMDFIEKTLMTNLHRTVFQQISSENEEKDLALQKRIRNLNWITAQHLETDINENRPEVRDLIDKAITDVIEMDSKRTPQEKLNCIVHCSKNIFTILLVCRGTPASADEFLPAMVYIVLKANPPLLQSNIKFITNYSIPNRLMSGEGGYYFTNLCCAVAFIENLTAESLNLSKEEYERYLSGDVVPPGGSDQTAAYCEGLRLMYQNLATLSDLRERQEKLRADALSLQDEMKKFKENISHEVHATLGQFFEACPYKIPGDFDASYIPSMLKSRVVSEIPKEEILVEIDAESVSSKGKIMSEKEDIIFISEISPLKKCSGDTKPLEEFAGMSLGDISTTIPAEVSLQIDQSSIPLHQLQVTLPTSSDVPLAAGMTLLPSQTPSDLLPSSTVEPEQCSTIQYPQVIQDVKFPTTVYSVNSSMTHESQGGQSLESHLNMQKSFRNESTHQQVDPHFVLDVPFAQASSHLQDPLSPETGSLEENLNLPPPLQPVVLQSNTNKDPQAQKCLSFDQNVDIN